MGSGDEGSLTPGTVLAGKYEIVEVLGVGGMGIVFEGRHLRLGNRVAIKVVRGDSLQNEEVVQRFAREARTAAQLRGKHVARVSDVDVGPDGRPFLVMEYLEGHDLGLELAQRQRLEVPEAVDYILQSCTAMAEAHALGIVHRDLKPHNLFLTEQDGAACIKVLDFGISKIDDAAHPSVTQTASALGTPLYMSPEQIRSAKHVDARSDIWSLGVILYEMIAGAPPFDGESLTAVVAAITADTPRPLAEACPEAPRALSDAVMRALCKRPDERFETVHAFAEAIAPFGPLGVWSAPRMSLSSSPRVSRADALDALPTRRLNQHTAKSWATGTLARRRRRTSRRALLSMALVLLAGAVAVLFFLQSRRGEPEPAAPEPVVEAVPAIPEEPAAEPEPEIATSAAPSASASAVVSAAPPASPVPARPKPSAPAPKPTPPVENPLTL